MEGWRGQEMVIGRETRGEEEIKLRHMQVWKCHNSRQRAVPRMYTNANQTNQKYKCTPVKMEPTSSNWQMSSMLAASEGAAV